VKRSTHALDYRETENVQEKESRGRRVGVPAR
jgi:hypothetical protein